MHVYYIFKKKLHDKEEKIIYRERNKKSFLQSKSNWYVLVSPRFMKYTMDM